MMSLADAPDFQARVHRFIREREARELQTLNELAGIRSLLVELVSALRAFRGEEAVETEAEQRPN